MVWCREEPGREIFVSWGAWTAGGRKGAIAGKPSAHGSMGERAFTTEAAHTKERAGRAAAGEKVVVLDADGATRVSDIANLEQAATGLDREGGPVG